MMIRTIARLLKCVLPGFCLALLLILTACAGLPGGGTGSATPTVATQPTQAVPTTPASVSNALLNVNLIVNGNAETGTGSPDDSSLVSIPGWTRQGNFNIMQYQTDDQSYQGVNSPGAADRGKNFFYGGAADANDDSVSSATQTIDVTAAAVLLNTGKIKFTLSGWLGGLAGQDDNAKLSVQFLSITGQALGSASLGPVLDADRKGVTCLLTRTANGTVPTGTAKVIVTLTMTRTDGSDNDGSADDLSLTFHP